MHATETTHTLVASGTLRMLVLVGLLSAFGGARLSAAVEASRHEQEAPLVAAGAVEAAPTLPFVADQRLLEAVSAGEPPKEGLPISPTQAGILFSPLRPVDVSGPREVLGDFLARMAIAEALHDAVTANYIASGRLFLNPEETAVAERTRSLYGSATQTLNYDAIADDLQSHEGRLRIALALKEVLDRIPLPPPDQIPDGETLAAESQDRWSIPGTEIEIRRVDSGDHQGDWLFSPPTVERLPDFYEKVRHLPKIDGAPPTDRFADFNKSIIGMRNIIPPRWMLALPPWMTVTWLDQPVWRWLGFLVAVGVVLLVRHLAGCVMRCVIREDAEHLLRNAWARTLHPLVMLAMLWWLRYFCMHNLLFGYPVYMPLVTALTASLYLMGIWGIWALARAVGESVIRTQHMLPLSVDGQLARLTARLLALVFTVMLIIEGANRLGLPVYSVVAGLGVGGIAIALAAKESLGNLLGSFTVMIEKPFRLGDYVRVGDIEGIVTQVGFRSTRVRTFYDSELSIPSSKIIESNIDNLGRRKVRRVMTTLGVTYDTSPEKIRAFVDAVKELIAGHPHTSKENCLVAFNDFGDSSLNIMVSFFLNVPDRATEIVQREDVLLKIVDLAASMNVQFAFPTRTLHVASAPSGAAGPPSA